jgi:hypothetical protein
LNSVQQAFEPILGALVLFIDDPDILYFLPLSKCDNLLSPEIEDLDLIPLNCSTSLDERWIAFFEILLNQSTKMIFNYQLTLLPILAAYYGLREDLSVVSRLSGYKMNDLMNMEHEHEILR